MVWWKNQLSPGGSYDACKTHVTNVTLNKNNLNNGQENMNRKFARRIGYVNRKIIHSSLDF